MTGADGRIHIRLMNDYSAEMPLWDHEGHTDGSDLPISDGLRADLEAFAARWDAAVPREVTDDRWDGVPVMSDLVRLRYALHRLLHPAEQRAARAEDEAMRALGEELRVRLQEELGDQYVVTYVD